MRIIYKSNAGVIIDTEKVKIAIDLLCDAGELPYISSAPEMIENVVNRKQPYEKIDYMLYTHKHMDHFSAKYVNAYMAGKNPARLILPYSAAEELEEKSFADKEKYVSILALSEGESKVFSEKSVKITAHDFKHEGSESADEKNIGYLIETEGKKILHVGDAAIDKKYFINRGLEKEGIDLLITPFPYITRRDGVELILEHIKPKKLVIVHLPEERKDVCGWIKATVGSANKVRDYFDELKLFTEIDQQLLF